MIFATISRHYLNRIPYLHNYFTDQAISQDQALRIHEFSLFLTGDSPNVMDTNMQTINIVKMDNPVPYFRLFSLLLIMTTFCVNAQAGNAWQVSTTDGSSVAISPTQNMIIKMRKPSSGLWGMLYVSIDDTQIKNLQKHRLDQYFSFISVGLDVDGYTRNANAKIVKSQNFLRIDIDQRMWDGFKKGDELTVMLPEGSTYKETLRGSSSALKKLEVQFFNN